MILKDVIKSLDVKSFVGDDKSDILGVSFNSSKVRKGFLFVALSGEKTDGHKYIADALRRGAKAVLVEKKPQDALSGVSVIEVQDSRSSLARVAANFFSHPTKDLVLVGITGTNGKTTITYLLESIWEKENRRPGVIGTVNYRYRGRVVPSGMTTPESLDLMEMIREMKDSGVKSIAMEVSSHALEKKRALECHFDAAVFTNLTRDHLDYHKTMDSYLDAKKKLFTELLASSEKELKYSIVNVDDPYGTRIITEAPKEIITYSVNNKDAPIHARRSEVTRSGIWAVVQTPSGELEISSKLFGEHNLSNILASVAVAVSLGSSPRSIEEALYRLDSIPGRLESIENPLGICVLVDYAHTPDALKNALLAARALTEGNLILVFGCGGNRDRAKRAQMGTIGQIHSDILIVTSDNPRTESSELIIDDIEAGIADAKKVDGSYYRITDRREAITHAIQIVSAGDTVLIAGKGHEDYQIVGKVKHHFDDREVARETIRNMMS